MTIQEIYERWQPLHRTGDASRAWWNHKAPHFARPEAPTAETSLALRLIDEHSMLKPGDTVLDIGCGGGRYAFALENLGASVTAFDFAPGMIEACEERKKELESGVSFRVEDWYTLDVKERGWEKAFDVVLANMTPAISSAAGLDKMTQASRGWCVMTKPTRRSDDLFHALLDELGLLRNPKGLDDNILYAFELLWAEGYEPRLEYQHTVWESSWTYEEALKEYSLRLSSRYELTEEQLKQLPSLLSKRLQDGRIYEKSETTIAAVYWKV